jgi:hypothetical protein
MRFISRRSSNVAPVAAGFLAGLAVGGALVALLTPVPGRWLVRRLKADAKKGLHAVGSVADEATDLARKGRKRMRTEGDRISTAVDAVRSALA